MNTTAETRSNGHEIPSPTILNGGDQNTIVGGGSECDGTNTYKNIVTTTKVTKSTSSSSTNGQTTANGSETSTETETLTTTADDKGKVCRNGSTSPLHDVSAGEALKIIEHLKNIEKINEKRRVFLANSLSEYSAKDEQKFETSSNTIANGATNNGDGSAIVLNGKDNSNDTIKIIAEQQRMHIREESHINDGNYDNTTTKTSTTTTTAPAVTRNAATSTSFVYTPKYATLPSGIQLRSPVTPPPKPPMLSRSSSSSSSTPTPSPTSPTVTRADFVSTATVTTITVPEPMPVTTVQLAGIDEEPPIMRQHDERPISMTERTSDQHNTQQISVRHYERLIEELKCPGCAGPMKAPILLCQTGHSICQQCTRVLLMCPLCKESFTDIRSMTVEALCSKAHFRCSNASGGCTVRLQIDLLTWHEKQCIYKPMKCFMGRVWGDCAWSGREAQWKEHLELEHANMVFNADSTDLIWNMGVKQKPLTGYYVFQVYDEMFNFYEIYDKERVLFTMTCTSTVRDKKHNYAYEVTMIHPDNEALAITHKYPVHSEYDNDILQEGTCVSISLAELAKFIDEEKLLHYRVRVLAVKSPRKSKAPRSSPNSTLPIDFQQTQIEGANLKSVPSMHIVTRKIDDLPDVDLTSTPTSSSNGATSLTDEDEMERVRRQYSEKLAKVRAAGKEESGSDTDPEFEAFIAKKWGTPQLHFNRKYLKNAISDTSSNEDANSQYKNGIARKELKLQLDDKASVCSMNTSYKKKMSNTLRKSFRALKTDFIEMKPFAKKSPEKTSPKRLKDGTANESKQQKANDCEQT